jgi:hypothetical protein
MGGVGLRGALLFLFFIVFIFKIFYVLFILVDDARRFIIYLIRKKKSRLKQLTTATTAPPAKETALFGSIPRSEFLMKAGLLAGAIPLYAIKHNMSKGLYDYQEQCRPLPPQPAKSIRWDAASGRSRISTRAVFTASGK